MERFTLTQRDDGSLVIDGFPDAVKLIALDDSDAKALGDLSLHATDLRFAAACFEALNRTEGHDEVVREALWRAALVAFFKCFGRNEARRSRLDPAVIYAREDPLALENFRHLKHLRNKHIVHDENAWSQALVGAILNPETAGHRIEKVVATTFSGTTLTQDQGNALYRLTELALAWVEAECDRLCNALTAQLERRPHSELVSRSEPTYTPPTAAQVGKKRKP